MNALFDFLATDTLLHAILIAGSIGGAAALLRYSLREMYSSEPWRTAQHWDV